MKVTKGQPNQEEKKVIAFYTGSELVFRDHDSDQNYVFSTTKSIYKGGYPFEGYLKEVQTLPGFITFYEGDTINIQL